ncbi:MAG: prolyl oligopeptidase family serine peptidase [Bacteroidota bacterium]
MKRNIIVLFLLIVAIPAVSFSQSNGKKPLDHSVYLKWKTVKHAIISNDGKWASYEINPLKGDGWLYFVNLTTFVKDSVARGCDAVFSPMGSYVTFKIKQPEDSIRKLKLAKKKDDELPKDSLGVYKMSTRNIVRFERVKSFKIPEKSGGWMAYQLEEKLEKKDTDKAKKADSVPVKKEKHSKKKKQSGTELVVLNPMTGASVTFENVTEYSFSENGSLLGIITVKKDSIDSTSVKVFHTTNSHALTLLNAAGSAKSIAIDTAGKQLTFLFSADTGSAKVFNLYYSSSALRKLVDTLSQGMPKGWSASENQRPSFSDDGSLLYFGTAPKPLTEPKDTLLDDEKIKLDLWAWTDGRLQSQQLKDLDADKKKSFTAVWDFTQNKMIQLADDSLSSISLLNNNLNVALGFNGKKYEKFQSWIGEEMRDVYIVDVKSGKRKLVLAQKQYAVSMSPFGKYIIYYNEADSAWYSYATSDATTTCLTKNLGVPFYDEDNDTPAKPSPYGIAGWCENDRYLLIYDRYDIWKADPSGKEKPVNLTGSYGRKNNIQLRIVKTNSELDYLESNKPLLLRGFDKVNRNTGFFQGGWKPASPKIIVENACSYDFTVKAKNADKVIFTMQNFTMYPDLWASNMKFEKPVRISMANPQQQEYLWGSVELVTWKSYDGSRLEGLLYKPANFDASKKYPAIVYFYEKYSDQLNNHWIPSPSRSIVNPAFYTSNGYVIFMPDITYTTGQPGKSAYDDIMSGTDFICSLSFVDANRLGIQGQSWGGYQVSYMVTQTSRYKAAMSGAGVCDMVSAYGGIRWESGISRMWQYETAQSRIGKTLWENPELYIKNSPIFFADKVQTPLLMMNNDNDGAVPWQQGIEYFSALRRLSKPVWMLNYNGDAHNLEKWPNRVDLSIRMKEFFDFYLKDAPEPTWMKTGIPAIDKGKKLNY